MTRRLADSTAAPSLVPRSLALGFLGLGSLGLGSLGLGSLMLASLLAGTASADPGVVGLDPLEAGQRDGIGESVAASGDVIVVGAPAQGAVFVFGRTIGIWSQRQRIVGPVGAVDGFGTSVAIDGTRILIGAPGHAGGDGSVHVFDLDRTRASWTERQVLTIGRPGHASAFGAEVELEGDRFAISAPAEDDGVVYMFRPTLPDVWIEQDRVTPTDPAAGMRFGTAIDLDDDTLAVAAPGHAGGDGALYLFDLSGQNWVQRARFDSPAPGSAERLGSDVDLAGATVLAGAADADRAYVFERRDAGVELLATLLPGGPAPAEEFGAAVALAGGVAIVADSGLAGGTGELSVFGRVGDAFVRRASIVPPGDVGHISFGAELGIDGDLLGTVAPASSASGAGAFAIDLRERTRGYIAPSSARFVPSQAKREKPGLAVNGTLDLGPDPVDLSLSGTLTVGDASIAFGRLTQAKAKKPFVFDDGSVSLSIKPSSSGSSRATFSLAVADVAATGLSTDGPLGLALETTAFAAEGSVVLRAGAFRSGESAADALGPLFVLDKLKAKAKGAGKGSFKLNGRLPGSGEAPDAPPSVTVRFGDGFEEHIPADRFKRKRSKWVFKDGKAAGVTSIVIDYSKGRVAVAAKRLSLASFGSGPVPFAVGLAVDGVSREARVTVVAKTTALRY